MNDEPLDSLEAQATSRDLLLDGTALADAIARSERWQYGEQTKQRRKAKPRTKNQERHG